MSQTHSRPKHGGEFLLSIVGIFEMPLPPVDELSDDSASKAAIKSPKKPTAPAKPKSKPEKPPKQNPKEKAAKVEKASKQTVKEKPAKPEKPQKTEKPKAKPKGKSAPMKRPAAGNAAGVADPANGQPQKKPACATKDTDRLSVCKSMYKRNGIWWSWMGKKWFGSFACIGCLELSLIFLHVTAECNLTATKVKPIDGVDPEEIENIANIAVPKSWNYRNGDCGLDVFCT